LSSQVTGRPRSRENLGYSRHPSVPSTTDDADDYPKDGTYANQLAWVRDRGYPEHGTHEAKLAWAKANGQLPPYPRHGTALEKNAWARLSTAYLTDTSDTKWHGEDLSEPLLEFTVNRRSGEVVSLRLVPRQQPRAQRPRQQGVAQQRRNAGSASSTSRDPALRRVRRTPTRTPL
jgi:hypothetical protein